MALNRNERERAQIKKLCKLARDVKPDRGKPGVKQDLAVVLFQCLVL